MRLENGKKVYSNPNKKHSDKDTLEDGQEILPQLKEKKIYTTGESYHICRYLEMVSAPKLEDSDTDGLDDYEEFCYKTNPLNNDTDGDGINDFDDPYKLLKTKKIQKSFISVKSGFKTIAGTNWYENVDDLYNNELIYANGSHGAAVLSQILEIKSRYESNKILWQQYLDSRIDKTDFYIYGQNNPIIQDMVYGSRNNIIEKLATP